MADRVRQTANHPASITVDIEEGFIRAVYESGNYTAVLNLTRDEASALYYQLGALLQDSDSDATEQLAEAVTEDVERSTELTVYTVQFQNDNGKWKDGANYSTRKYAVECIGRCRGVRKTGVYRIVSSKGEIIG